VVTTKAHGNKPLEVAAVGVVEDGEAAVVDGKGVVVAPEVDTMISVATTNKTTEVAR